ncbi:glycosyltransferase family protein [Paenibacillus sp. 102]|uniref:glycosyltransferase family protein n=1 Tax=Paenibacillus sp. 102 TaxID=3120823 RepID=UPI0031BA2AA2
MNNKKVCFISCVNNYDEYNTALQYIRSLKIPDGYEIDTIAIENAVSLTSGYNEAMKKSDAKYKVYIHQDTYILHEDFLYDIIALFKKNPKLGVAGVLGAKGIPSLSGWPRRFTYGGLYQAPTKEIIQLLWFHTVKNDYERVLAVDGFIMFTQYDLPWREDIFQGWHFYDISQSLEFVKAGYEVGVVKQVIPWCLHDCGIISIEGYEENRNIFLQSYSNDIKNNQWRLFWNV